MVWLYYISTLNSPPAGQTKARPKVFLWDGLNKHQLAVPLKLRGVIAPLMGSHEALRTDAAFTEHPTGGNRPVQMPGSEATAWWIPAAGFQRSRLSVGGHSIRLLRHRLSYFTTVILTKIRANVNCFLCIIIVLLFHFLFFTVGGYRISPLYYFCTIQNIQALG